MAHFAKIDEAGLVLDVVVIEPEEVQTGHWGDPSLWVQTSYNTHGGVYYIPNSNPPEPDPDQSKAFRKNYAGIGYTYDSDRDAFIPPKPPEYPSWVVDDFTCFWIAPVPKPTEDPSPGFAWVWDEVFQNWVEVEIPPQPSVP